MAMFLDHFNVVSGFVFVTTTVSSTQLLLYLLLLLKDVLAEEFLSLPLFHMVVVLQNAGALSLQFLLCTPRAQTARQNPFFHLQKIGLLLLNLFLGIQVTNCCGTLKVPLMTETQFIIYLFCKAATIWPRVFTIDGCAWKILNIMFYFSCS